MCAGIAGPLATRLAQILDELNIQVQAFWQAFIGNHCVKGLENSAYFFNELEKVASKNNVEAEFKDIRARLEPVWEALYEITRVSLAARKLETAEIDSFCRGCGTFVRLAQGLRQSSDKEGLVPLKRHMYAHMIDSVKIHKTVGLFAESPFESIHAIINKLEAAYLGMTNKVERDKAIRRGFVCKQNTTARESQRFIDDSTALGPRKI